ncbi:MAG: tRNA lysidine(34) synthetase TilS [Bacteroidales bacterium]|nr:tRNA lysidine(34) synthetase TilS [Bacteroidales bacterium]
MLKRFKTFIKENNLIKTGDRILLAVSGGIDSMVMTHLFLSLDNDLGIAHCNFSLRGKEADMDEEMVRQFAADHNIPFYTKRFDTKAYAKANGISIEMAARDLRFKWFEEIRKENNYDSVAVAHNMNDNIETLIINLTRGTGLAGLSGMRPSHNGIIRPLLFATREEITNYRDQHQISFREDQSNTETNYVRNKIRHLVIPVLKAINPSIETTLNDTAKRFAGINEIVSEYISELKRTVSEQKDELVSFDAGRLKTHLHNKALLYELFKPYGINNQQLCDLTEVIEGKTGGWLLTGTHRIVKNRKEIIITQNNSENNHVAVIHDISGFGELQVIASAGYADIDENFIIPADRTVACIDSAKVLFPVIIRKWQAGDYFYPLGMNQKKKLSDYFIDNKYSIIEKENKLILESDGKIVWIIGDRIDNRFRITKSTKKALIIKAK